MHTLASIFSVFDFRLAIGEVAVGKVPGGGLGATHVILEEEVVKGVSSNSCHLCLYFILFNLYLQVHIDPNSNC